MRLVRQLLAECVCLSLVAAGLGICFARLGVAIIRRELNWGTETIEWAREIVIDPNVLLYTLAIVILGAFLFGIFPAWQVAHRHPAGTLSEASRWATSGRKQHRLQKALVVSQLALSLVLFVGAGLFVEGFIEEMRAKTGFNESNLLTASISLRGPTYDGSTQHQTAFFSNLLEKLRSNSQVQSAALTDALPFNFPSQAEFTVEANTGKPEQKASSGYVTVSPEYFSALQVPLLEGREFVLSDNSGMHPVVVVNRAFAKRYFGSADPIEHYIRIDRDNSGNQWSEVVGIVGDVHEFLGQQAARPHIYTPLLAHPESEMKIVVRTRTSPEIFAGALRGAVAAIDSDQAVTNVRTMQRVINDSGAGDDLMSGLMSTFALIALVMAAIGTYGVLSYVVGQRTKEMGIRMAVGANPGQVRRMIVRSGASLAAVGVLLGVSCSLALPKLMASVFSGFGFHSGLVITAAPVTVLMIALVACYIPARRAAKVDPNVALRYE